jgi:uncharacterized protein YndB with AHSA1/START domain
MKPAQNLSVCVVRRFSASPERVFDAWLDPAMVGRFMFGPGLRDEETQAGWTSMLDALARSLGPGARFS